MNKRGFMVEMIAFAVIGIIVVLFFAGFIYASGLINTTLKGSNLDVPGANLTQATENIYTPLDTGYGELRLIAAIIMIGYALASIIVAYYSKNHPVMFVLFFFMTILLIVFSVYISNAYETLSSNEAIGTTLQSFSIANVLVKYLPYWIGIIGLISSVVAVIGIISSREAVY